jgi:hypothetical protein
MHILVFPFPLRQTNKHLVAHAFSWKKLHNPQLNTPKTKKKSLYLTFFKPPSSFSSSLFVFYCFCPFTEKPVLLDIAASAEGV